jgi:hypothetical protein
MFSRTASPDWLLRDDPENELSTREQVVSVYVTNVCHLHLGPKAIGAQPFYFDHFEGLSKVILRPEGKPIRTAVRGAILMDIERKLRTNVDRSIQVFLAPRGDLNKLRVKTRGVKV